MDKQLSSFLSKCAPGWKPGQGPEKWFTLAWEQVSSGFRIGILFVLISGIFFVKTSTILPPLTLFNDLPLLNTSALADANEFDLVSAEIQTSKNWSGTDPYISGGVPFGWKYRPHHRLPVLAGLLGNRFGHPYLFQKGLFFLGLFSLPFLLYGACWFIWADKKRAIISLAITTAGVAYFFPYSFSLIQNGRMGLVFSPFLALFGVTALFFHVKSPFRIISGALALAAAYLFHPSIFWFASLFLLANAAWMAKEKKLRQLIPLFLGVCPIAIFMALDARTFQTPGLMAGLPAEFHVSAPDLIAFFFPLKGGIETGTQAIIRGSIVIMAAGSFFTLKNRGMGEMEGRLALILAAVVSAIFAQFLPVSQFFETQFLLVLPLAACIPLAADFLASFVFNEMGASLIIASWFLWFLMTRQIANPSTLPHLEYFTRIVVANAAPPADKNQTLLIEDHPLFRPVVARLAHAERILTMGYPSHIPYFQKEKDNLFAVNRENGRLEIFDVPFKSLPPEKIHSLLQTHTISKIWAYSPQANEALVSLSQQASFLTVRPGWLNENDVLFGILVDRKKISDENL